MRERGKYQVSETRAEELKANNDAKKEDHTMTGKDKEDNISIKLETSLSCPKRHAKNNYHKKLIVEGVAFILSFRQVRRDCTDPGAAATTVSIRDLMIDAIFSAVEIKHFLPDHADTCLPD
ncbi:hypothetical protein NDU88_002628 [Pleurodeles waltl]|uniref:Uncharacterized protein n=1 Tax=Pleurodeles waltl TaxID=8319 RepID=A0AAV7SDA3_PLEWA|nr:hypothetical protein NDU88_002628 [Pleurodeles waltl]